jgi:hypothetical protein
VFGADEGNLVSHILSREGLMFYVISQTHLNEWILVAWSHICLGVSQIFVYPLWDLVVFGFYVELVPIKDA